MLEPPTSPAASELPNSSPGSATSATPAES